MIIISLLLLATCGMTLTWSGIKDVKVVKWRNRSAKQKSILLTLVMY